MATPTECPKCHSSLLGAEIPEDQRESYGGNTHFSTVIGIENADYYDGVLVYMCPHCQHKWPRFEEGTLLHKKGLDYLQMDGGWED